MPDGYANKLDMHPMRDAIVDALHAGETPRQVASWCEPAVSHQSVWKFKKLCVEPLQRQITESIERFAAQQGYLPMLADDDDISEADLASDEWLRATMEFKEKRVRPALERVRRRVALELLRSNGKSR